jgi:hypothetical protein
MTMYERLRPNDSAQTELPLTLSAAASPARTSVLPGGRKASLMEHAAAFGASSPVLLASFDPASQSWKTLQTCLVAQVNGQADGLAEFSATWPNSGIMLNGKTYQRQPWALRIAANAYGLLPTPVKYDSTPGGPNNHYKGLGWHGKHHWPTPTARDWKDGKSIGNVPVNGLLGRACGPSPEAGALNPPWVEWLMGFPIGWTALPPSETP